MRLSCLAGLEHWDHESVLPVLEPMLASTGAIAAPVEDWAFEPKLDGWRAMVYVDDAGHGSDAERLRGVGVAPDARVEPIRACECRT